VLGRRVDVFAATTAFAAVQVVLEVRIMLQLLEGCNMKKWRIAKLYESYVYALLISFNIINSL
jgi:hypothetical protein